MVPVTSPPLPAREGPVRWGTWELLLVLQALVSRGNWWLLGVAGARGASEGCPRPPPSDGHVALLPPQLWAGEQWLLERADSARWEARGRASAPPPTLGTSTPSGKQCLGWVPAASGPQVRGRADGWADRQEQVCLYP